MSYDWSAFLSGRNPYGQLGFGVENALAQTNAGTLDPRLYGVGTFDPGNGDARGAFRFNDPNLDPRGLINLNGQQYTNVGDLLSNASTGLADRIIDPSQVTYDDRYGAITSPSNIRVPDDWTTNVMPLLVMAGLGGPALGAALGGGSTAGIAATDAAESGGTLGLNAAGTGVSPYAGSAGLLSGPSSSYWNMLASNAGPSDAIDESAGLASGPTASNPWVGADYIGGIDPETAGGAGGMSSSVDGLGSGSWLSRIGGAINNPSSLMGGSGLLGSLGNAALANPLSTLGLVQAGVGLLAGGRHGPNPYIPQSRYQGKGQTPGAGGFHGGNSGFYVNPYTLSQLQRSYGGF